jgi:putative ABC transport system permease protein
MRSMIISMIVVSAIIFCVVMYLMMKVMIDRASFSISLVKIFGYRTAEIRKLYLNGNFYIVSIGALICIPFSKMLMDSMYPYLVSNVACGINLTFSWQLYIGIFGGILLLYFIINHLLVSRLKNIVPAEILKNRE